MSHPGELPATAALENGMRRTFAALVDANKTVVVLLDIPHLPFDPSVCLERPFMAIMGAEKKQCSFPRSQMPAWEAFDHYENLVRKVARDYPQVRIVNPMDFFCDDSFCHLAKDGVLLYQDRSHLN